MRIAITLVFLLATRFINCVSQDTITVYLTGDFEAAEKENARIIRQAVIINERYFITDQYTDGKMIMKGEYASVDPWIEDGPFMYYRSGELYALGAFNQGKMIGKWIYLTKERADTVDYDPVLKMLSDIKSETYRKKMPVMYTMVPNELMDYIYANIHFPPRMLNVCETSQVDIVVSSNKENIPTPFIISSEHLDFEQELIRALISAPDSFFNSASKIANNTGYEFIVYFTLNGTPQSALVDTSDAAYVFVDEPATFQGGSLEKFREWVQKNLIYPPSAVQNGEYGRIIIQFMVKSDGHIDNMKILSGSGSVALDNEAERVLSSSPLWKPARHMGRIVNQQFVFPVIFQLQ